MHFVRRSITRAYYRNSVGGLLLFDITNRRSFQNVHDWLEEARSHVQPHSIVFLLVGHKCDLEAERQVCPHVERKHWVPCFKNMAATKNRALFTFRSLIQDNSFSFVTPPSRHNNCEHLRVQCVEDWGQFGCSEPLLHH